jgi:hypothetical protein
VPCRSELLPFLDSAVHSSMYTSSDGVTCTQVSDKER